MRGHGMQLDSAVGVVADMIATVCTASAADSASLVTDGVFTTDVVRVCMDCLNCWLHADAAAKYGTTPLVSRGGSGSGATTAAKPSSTDVALLVMRANVWHTVSRCPAWGSEIVADAAITLLHNCLGAVYVGLCKACSKPLGVGAEGGGDGDGDNGGSGGSGGGGGDGGGGAAGELESQDFDSPGDSFLGVMDDFAARYQVRQEALGEFNAKLAAWGSALRSGFPASTGPRSGGAGGGGGSGSGAGAGAGAGTKPLFLVVVESLETVLLRRARNVGQVLPTRVTDAAWPCPTFDDAAPAPVLGARRCDAVLSALAMVWAVVVEAGIAPWKAAMMRYGESSAVYLAATRAELGQRRYVVCVVCCVCVVCVGAGGRACLPLS